MHQEWLDQALDITLNTLAVLISHSLLPSLEQGFSLGFLCPWKCLNDRVASHFSDNNLFKLEVGKPAVKESLISAIAKAARMEWQSLAVQDIRKVLDRNPQAIAAHITIGTSISSASANVRHSVVFLPRHTRFTGELEQSIVACARATGMMLLICPLVCRSGFFKTFIPLVCQLRGLLRTKGKFDIDSLVGALSSSQPQPALPWDIPITHGLHVAPVLDFTSKPFGL